MNKPPSATFGYFKGVLKEKIHHFLGGSRTTEKPPKTILKPTKTLLKVVLELLLDVLEVLLKLLDLSWRSWTCPGGPSTGPKAPTGWFVSSFQKMFKRLVLETLKGYRPVRPTKRMYNFTRNLTVVLKIL